MPAWGKRHTVFAIICLVNLTVWMDEGIFGALTPYWAKDFHLTPTQIGTGSAAYLLGYFPLLFVAGVLADRFGAKRMLLFCVIGCSVLSAAMLLVHDYATLVVRNILFGVCFGFLWAPCNRLISLWLPAHERVRYGAIWFSSCMFSFVIAAPLGLMLAAYGSWSSAFLIVTFLGIPGALLLAFATTEKPEQTTSISRAELDYIYSGQEGHSGDTDEFSWRKLGIALRQRSVFWIVVATCLATTPGWLIGTWGIYALVNLYHIEGSTASALVATGFMVTVIYGFFHGWVFEHVFGGRCRPALVTGSVISGLGFLVAAHTSSPVVLSVALFAAGSLCNPFFWGTVNAYWAAIAKPEFTGTLNGISAAGQVAGGYIIVSLSGTWVRPAATAGVHATDTIWIVGGIVFLLTVIPVYLAREVRIQTSRPASVVGAVEPIVS
jgi:MFS family permease